MEYHLTLPGDATEEELFVLEEHLRQYDLPGMDLELVSKPENPGDQSFSDYEDFIKFVIGAPATLVVINRFFDALKNYMELRKELLKQQTLRGTMEFSVQHRDKTIEQVKLVSFDEAERQQFLKAIERKRLK